MTKTTYNVGDKVRILNVRGIQYAAKYFNDGDIAIVKETRSINPTIGLRGTTGSDVYIMTSELKYIEKVVPVVSAKVAEKIAAHGYKVGDKMRMLRAGSIAGGGDLTNGKVYEVAEISSFGNPKITDDGGDSLAIVGTELGYVEKVVEVAPMKAKAPSKADFEQYRVGDKVRILRVAGIMFGERYWNNGDTTTVTQDTSRGNSLKLDRKDGDSDGLIITTRELRCIEKVEVATKTAYESFRVGDQVRILNVAKIAFGDNYWKTGDITTVVAVSRNGSGSLRLDRKNGERIGLIITERESQYLAKTYEAPVAVKSTIESTPTMHTRLVALEAKVAEQAAKIHALETGNVDVITTTSYDSQPVITFAPTAPTKNVERAAVIAKAKKFVTDITDEMGNGRNAHRGNNTFRRYMTKPVFTETGRTVSVKVVGKYGSTQVFETASATASQNDTFNRHIGEAIVLGRALGLDVTEFENAPQPTHLVVGTITRGTHVGIETTARVANGRAYDKHGKWWDEKIAVSTYLRVLDDTDADYGMGEF